MNNNLPEIKKDGILVKFKNWFKRLFYKEDIIEEPIQETIKGINNNIEEIKKNDFKDSIQAESKDRILVLQRKLKEKQIEIADLTDEELDEMIVLYKSQIEEKKDKLKQYRNKMMKNKKEV